jgi:ferredoxin
MPVELEMEKDLLDLLDVSGIAQPMRCDSTCSSCPSALVAGLFVPDAWQRCLDQVTVTQPATVQHRHFVSGHGRLGRSQTYQKLLNRSIS